MRLMHVHSLSLFAVQILDAGVAPPVVLAATHAKALDHVSLDLLKDHAVDGSAVQQ